MVKKLIFEYCKENGSSTLIDLELNGDKYALKTASGRNGMYLAFCGLQQTVLRSKTDALRSRRTVINYS